MVIRVGEIEGAEHRGEVLAIDEAVDRAARRGEVGDQVEGLPTGLALRASGDAQHAVAHGLEIQPTAVHAPEQLVLGVLGQSGGLRRGRLAEGGRQHERTQETLHGPTVGDEAGRQVFQEGGVLGRRGADAEIARSLHQRLPEDLQPDAVHHHAGGERIGRAGDGLGELAAAAAFGERTARGGGEDLEELARDGLARASGVAAQQDGAVHGLGLVDHHHRARRALGVGRLVGLGLADQLAVALRVGGGIGADQGFRGGRGRAVRRLDEFRPRLAARFRGLAARRGQEVGIGRRQIVELLRQGLGQFRAEQGVDRQVGLRQQLGGEGRGELVVGRGGQPGPEAPDRVVRLQPRLDDLLPAGEHGRVERQPFRFLVGVELRVGQGAAEQGQVGGRLGRAEGTLAAGRHEVGPFLLQAGELGLELHRLLGRREGLQQRFLLRLLGGAEDRVQRVVLARRDRVELVVVAAGAGHGQALHPAHHDIDAVVDDVVLVVQEAAPQRQVAERGEVAVVLAGRQVVGRELELQEAVIGQVAVEGGDDPVAVGVGVGVAALLLEDVALGVGVTRDVEPVASPAFAEGRRGEEPIDELLGRLRVAVLDEGLEFERRRRQPPERQVEPAGEHVAGRLGRERQALGLEAGEDEGVDGRADTVGGADVRHRGGDDRLESPMLARVGDGGTGLRRPG